MHPAGCFGSSLAYSEKSKACSACSAKSECAALVKARRPAMLNLLKRFSDGKGNTMAHHWLTPAEKKKIRDIRKRKQLEEEGHETAGAHVRQAIVDMLKLRPHTKKELMQGVAIKCSYSASSAREVTYRELRALNAESVVKQTSKIIELA